MSRLFEYQPNQVVDQITGRRHSLQPIFATFSKSLLTTYSNIHPRHQKQVASELLKFACDKNCSDIAKYNAHETQRITVGEYRIEYVFKDNRLDVLDLFKLNDGYKP